MKQIIPLSKPQTLNLKLLNFVSISNFFQWIEENDWNLGLAKNINGLNHAHQMRTFDGPHAITCHLYKNVFMSIQTLRAISILTR